MAGVIQLWRRFVGKQSPPWISKPVPKGELSGGSELRSATRRSLRLEKDTCLCWARKDAGVEKTPALTAVIMMLHCRKFLLDEGWGRKEDSSIWFGSLKLWGQHQLCCYGYTLFLVSRCTNTNIFYHGVPTICSPCNGMPEEVSEWHHSPTPTYCWALPVSRQKTAAGLTKKRYMYVLENCLNTGSNYVENKGLFAFKVLYIIIKKII